MQALPCPIAAQCGGCPSMEADIKRQEVVRRERLEKAVRRPVDQTISSPRTLGYRARLLLRPGPDGRLGYTQPRSHDPLPITHCPVARDEINAVLQTLGPVPSNLAGVELRSDGQRVVLSASSRRNHGKRRGHRKSGAINTEALVAAAEQTTIAGVALDGKTLTGNTRVHLSVGGIEHRLHPRSFYQVNLEMNDWLVRTVGQLVSALQPRHVLDLYAGAGNLSLPLAAQGIPVTLIEQSPTAVADARATAKRQSLQADIRAGDAGAFSAGDAFFEVAILDPPRGGAPGVMAELIVTKPRRIIYVSCNPVTLARDIRPAMDAGYTLTRLDFLDMFPQTHHAEALCVLDR